MKAPKCVLCHNEIPLLRKHKQNTRYCSPLHAKIDSRRYSGETLADYAIRQSDRLKKKIQKRLALQN